LPVASTNLTDPIENPALLLTWHRIVRESPAAKASLLRHSFLFQSETGHSDLWSETHAPATPITRRILAPRSSS